ncbi:hypothetical protein [Marinactinospora rubrisoli]|uniref:Uncharacterized protein n=1 Tax=Marinactinospora rubrisoli TaxID=2715399 RepID=A0ABW2KG92_9ACTN
MPTTANVHAIRELLGAAGPQDWTRQVAGAGDVLGSALEVVLRDHAWRLPVELADAVLAAGDIRLIDGLLRAAEVPRDGDLTNAADRVARRALRRRLAASGHPRVARRILDRDSPWRLRERRAVLATARADDPGWTSQSGVVSWLLAQGSPRVLRAGVVCELPGVARHVLERVGAELLPAEQLRALWTVHEHDGGLPALRTLEAGGPPAETAALLERVTATDDTAPLRAALAEAEGTPGAISELRDTTLHLRGELLELRDTLDWPAVTEAAREKRFDEEATRLLAGRDDCPEETSVQLFAARPEAVAGHAARIGPRLLTAPPAGAAGAKHVRTMVRRGFGNGATGTDLLEHARPAGAVLEAARQRPDGPRRAQETWDDFTAALGTLVADRLGADPERWRVLRARLKTFKGTVAELLDEVAAGGGRPPKPGWPDGGAMPEPGRAASPSGARAAFLTLLNAAPDDHLDLLRHVDDRTVYDLLAHGTWRPGWLDFAVASGNGRYAAALARRGSLDTEGIDRLMRRDDPAINAQLFLRANATAPQRERLLSGRPFDPARATPLPLDPALVAHLLKRSGGWRPRDPMDCADPRLQRHILRHIRVRGVGPQLRLLLNTWERHGPAEVAALIGEDLKPVTYSRNPFRRETKALVKKLLAAKDPDAALADLRRTVAEGETAEWQIAAIRKEQWDNAELYREAHPWHWDELRKEHRREPFSAMSLAGLANIPECPASLRHEAARTKPLREQWRTVAYARMDSGQPLPEQLSAPSGAAPEASGTAPDRVGDRERADWRAWLAGGIPAEVALAQLPEHPAAETGRAELAALLRDTLDGRPEAWALALRMLPDFPGSVAELLRTATTAAS